MSVGVTTDQKQTKQTFERETNWKVRKDA